MTEFELAVLPLPALSQEELFPIREVSRLTGVNPVTLRAWERRYGLIQPTRTESGHRLYSMDDINTVRSILGWIERGVAVSKIGKLLARNPGTQNLYGVPLVTSPGEWLDWQQQLRMTVSDFDEQALERLYGQVFSRYPLSVLFESILMPLWHQLQSAPRSFGQTSEWLFFDAFLRRRVLQRLQSTPCLNTQRILLVALPEHCRKLELLVAGLLLGDGERAVSVLAIGQPLDELTLVCEKMRPQALVLYSNHAASADLPRQLTRLALAVECPVMLAGTAAELLQERLRGSAVGCLGSEGRLMRQRLQQLLAGKLDT